MQPEQTPQPTTLAEALLLINQLQHDNHSLRQQIAHATNTMQPLVPNATMTSSSVNANKYSQRIHLSLIDEYLGKLFRELDNKETDRDTILPLANQLQQEVNEQVVVLREEQYCQFIPNPYLVGVPLSANQALFVGRTDVIARIEHHLLNQNHPPMLLYGQRRMGKTSLLNNLDRLLNKSTVLPLFVDLQGPATRVSDHAGFLYNIARTMCRQAKRHDAAIVLPALSREELAIDPFTVFDEWLEEVVTRVVAHGKEIILLSLDEIEVLHGAFQKGVLEEDKVLGMLRYTIQHRSNINLLLSGSHPPEDYKHWSNYFISVQAIHISYLSVDDTIRLIEEPVPDFPLRYEPAATQRIIALTNCHPALVQLLCYEIVVAKNYMLQNHTITPHANSIVTVADVEVAIIPAQERGSFFFANVEQNRLSNSAVHVLRVLAKEGEGACIPYRALCDVAPATIDDDIRLLLQRELIEAIAPTNDCYRFQVELIRRWFDR